jgi:thymidylate synthase
MSAEINAWSIDEAWRLACKQVMLFGHIYTVQRGSYEGQQRKQLARLMLVIERPDSRPLAPICKTGEIPVTDEGAIETYFANYLASPHLAKDEQYTYGNRIHYHLKPTAKRLKETPGTNQAVIEIARPEDVLLDDPPCLRVLDWKVCEGKLWLSSYWRSWDVHGALPVNLGGLQLLNEMMAEWAKLEPGPQVAYSSGAHVYDHAWGLVQ